jgi:hypothetical protein
MTWQPDRPGNWLLHCHLAFHVVPEAAVLETSPLEHGDALSHDADRHMAGLILGITVPPARGWREPKRSDPERLTLIAQEGVPRGSSPRAMGYVLQRGSVPPSDSIGIPGPTLVLTRGRPTDITVVNRLKEPTAVHWHGIELESYSDGVAGWSGMRRRLAPSIAPGDSFVARLTLPRAGTFIYHTDRSRPGCGVGWRRAPEAPAHQRRLAPAPTRAGGRAATPFSAREHRRRRLRPLLASARHVIGTMEGDCEGWR